MMMERLARTQLARESNPEVVHALETVVAHHGDLERSLQDLATEPPKYRSIGSLLDRLDEVLMGRRELRRRFDEYRRAMVTGTVEGHAVADQITSAANLICSVAQFGPPVAAIAFLSSLPSGVRLQAGPRAPLTSHPTTVGRLAQAQLPLEPDPEVVRALKVVVAHGGDLALSLRDVALGLDRAGEAEPITGQEAVRLSSRTEALQERLDEVLMGRAGVKARLEAISEAVVENIVKGDASPGKISEAAALIASTDCCGRAVAAIAFLASLRIVVGAQSSPCAAAEASRTAEVLLQDAV